MKNIFILLTLLFSTIALAAPGVSAKKIGANSYGICVSDGSSSGCPMQTTLGQIGGSILGRTDAIENTSAYVGSFVRVNQTTSQGAAWSSQTLGSFINSNIGDLTVPAGNWLLHAQIPYTGSTSDGTTSRLVVFQIRLRNTTDASTLYIFDSNVLYGSGGAGTTYANGTASFMLPVSFSSGKTIRAEITFINFSGTAVDSTPTRWDVNCSSIKPCHITAYRR